MDQSLDKLKLSRKDFQLILVLFAFDIGLTFYGIFFSGGSEGSPFFRPFTSGLDLFVAGSLIYIGILAILNVLLSGRFRTVLSSTAIGMHIGGIISWIIFVSSIERGVSVSYLFLVTISLATATAYSELKKRGWTY